MSKAPRDLSAMIQRQPTYTAPELDAPEVTAAPKKRGPKPKVPREDARRLSLELDGETYMALRMRAGMERKTHQQLIEEAVKSYLRTCTNK